MQQLSEGSRQREGQRGNKIANGFRVDISGERESGRGLQILEIRRSVRKATEDFWCGS